MRRRQASATTKDVGRDSLTELALDLRWSWHHGTDELWSELDPELWALTHNPWVVLQAASPTRVEEHLARPAVRARVERLLAQRRGYQTAPAWFQHAYPQAPLSRVGYFSMEFALSEALPIYSGGLGNVAGDQLKAASDLGVPVVGVGNQVTRNKRTLFAVAVERVVEEAAEVLIRLDHLGNDRQEA